MTDTANAFIQIAESDESIGRIINFGSNFEISIGKTVELIAEVMGSEVDIISDKKRFRPDNSEVEQLYADISLAKKIYGWQNQSILELKDLEGELKTLLIGFQQGKI